MAELPWKRTRPSRCLSGQTGRLLQICPITLLDVVVLEDIKPTQESET